VGLSKKVFKATLIFTSLTYLSFFIGIVGQILLARLLLPSDFVPFVISLSIIEIVYAFGSIGLNNALLSYQEEENIFGTAFYMILLIGSSLFFILYIYIYFSSHDELKNIIIPLALAKSIGMLSIVYSTYLEKDFNHYLVGSIDVFAKIFSVFMAVYLASTGIKTEALVYKEVIYIVLNIGLLFIFVNKSISYKFSYRSFKKLTTFSYKFFFYRMIQVTNKNIPILFLGKMTGAGSALYERSFYLGGLTSSVLSPFNSKIAYAFYTKVQDDLNRVKKGVELNLYVTFRITLPLAIIFLLYAKEIVELFYGKNWIEAHFYLQGLAGFVLFFSLFAIVENFIISRHKIGLSIFIRVISLVIMLATIFYIYFFNASYYLLAWSFSFSSMISFLYLLIKTLYIIDLNLKEVFLKPILFIFIASTSFFIDSFILALFSFSIVYLFSIIVFEKAKIKSIVGMFR